MMSLATAFNGVRERYLTRANEGRLMDASSAWVYTLFAECHVTMLGNVFTVLITVCALMLSACSSTVPRLHQPDRVDAFCGDRAAIPTAIESIVSSSGDVTGQPAAPPDARIRAMVEHSGGIIAHWRDQPLYQPSIAKTLGLATDFVTLGDAAISNAPPVNGSRPMYLTLKTAAGSRTFAVQAFDVQDVCNQGKLSS